MKKCLSVLLSVLLLFSLSLTAAPGYAAPLLGDVNEDGVRDSADARLILRASVKLQTFTQQQMQLADANGDGQVTSADSRLVLRASVGLEILGTAAPVSNDPPKLTNRDAFELWTTANTIYAGWLVMPLEPMGKGIVDENDYYFGEYGLPCYRVIGEGIRSKAQLSEYLSRYFEPEVYQDTVYSARLVENNGSLYYVVGGIGDCGEEVISLRLKNQSGATAVIELQVRDYFMGMTDWITYELHYRDGVWRFAAPFACCYDDLTYSGISY